jgi:hypothetical protein
MYHSGAKYYDFGIFFYAARMVWDGARTSLYDLHVQHAYQLQYGRPAGFNFVSPPFVLIPLLPFVLLPRWIAFLVWTVLMLALLAVAIRGLCLKTGLRYGNWPVFLYAGYRVSCEWAIFNRRTGGLRLVLRALA